MPRKQSQKSIDRLLKEFPEIRELYAPFSREGRKAIYSGVEVDVRVVVQRADPNLMYWQPDNVGVDSPAYLVGAEGTRGLREETCYLFDREGNRIANWCGERTGLRSGLLSVLFGHDALYKRLGHVVTLSQTFWYEDDSPMADEFDGTLKRVQAVITVYKRPSDVKSKWGMSVEGWAKLAEETDVLHNVKLFGAMLFPRPDLDDIWYRELVTVVLQYAKNFERLVWRRGFGEIVDKSTKKGMSGTFGDVKVTSYVMAGRVLIQLERGGVRFTMIGQDVVDDPRMGFQSVDGTADELAAIVDDAILFWVCADDATRQTCYHDDTKVGIL